MKPLFVLFGAFIISLGAIRFFTRRMDYPLSGRIAMSIMLLFTAMGHFVFTKGMSLMLPHFIPFKSEVIYFTGVLEMVAAVGLLLPQFSLATGWALIVFFIVLIPGNIKAALHYINYEKGTFDGPGPNYLWFRIPLQVLFIVWTYLSAIRFNLRRRQSHTT